MKNQSAFSLIEVCIALLLLSFVVAWTSELLVERIADYQKAIVREKVVSVMWSIADSVQLDPSSQSVESHFRQWAERLENILAGSELKIQRNEQEALCVYTITITFGKEMFAPLELPVIVAG